MKSRSRTGKTPAPPPSTPEDGAKRIAAQLVGIFDRQDGTGADWPLVVESLFRAAFAALDRLPADAKGRTARRIHAGAYERMTAEESTAKPAPAPAEPTAAPSAAMAFTQTPQGPK